jgi:uroporphyrinogen-III synthase
VSAAPLAGRRIVITRPREQAEGLAARIREAGGEPVLFPVIEIRDLPDLGPFYALVDRLEAFDEAIFISPTAVRRALPLLHARRGRRPWPPALRVAAIGRGSRRALQEEGLAVALAPVGKADSEALLDLPEFASPTGRRVIIFRGLGGRELLGETLTARGAQVAYAECYVRARPDAAAGLVVGEGFLTRAVDAVTVTSGEGLANLYAMLDASGREQMLGIPLFVPHARVAAQAEGLGVLRVNVCGASDDEMMAALVAYFRSAK